MTTSEDFGVPPEGSSTPEPRCAFIPPTIGYDPCTRARGHEGPCAHQLSGRIFGPLKTREEYDAALTEIEELVDIDPLPGTYFGRELARLVALVQEFEHD